MQQVPKRKEACFYKMLVKNCMPSRTRLCISYPPDHTILFMFLLFLWFLQIFKCILLSQKTAALPCKKAVMGTRTPMCYKMDFFC